KRVEEKTESQGGLGDSWGKKKDENKPQDGLKGQVNKLLIKGVIRDGTGRRNKNKAKVLSNGRKDEMVMLAMVMV
ncbi:hypothetical protein Tco_1161167, partial [Tanacetum coccineum]